MFAFRGGRAWDGGFEILRLKSDDGERLAGGSGSSGSNAVSEKLELGTASPRWVFDMVSGDGTMP